MDREQIAGYGEQRLKEHDASRRAHNALYGSITDEERMRRLNALSSEQRTSYALALMDEHSQRMHAFRDAPVDEVFEETEDRSSAAKDRFFGLRAMDVPDIGKFSLRIINGDAAEVLQLMIDHGGDNYVTHQTLAVAGQREASEPFDVERESPFQNHADFEMIEIGSITEGDHVSVLALAALEDRVETLRAICKGAGIEINPATVDELPPDLS